MSIRTYARTFFNDLFKNNFLIKAFSAIVNFYCNLSGNTPNSLKFYPNMSIKELKERESISFKSVTGDEIDCK